MPRPHLENGGWGLLRLLGRRDGRLLHRALFVAADHHDLPRQARMASRTWDHVHESPKVMWVPLLVLAAGSIIAGMVGAPCSPATSYESFWRHVHPRPRPQQFDRGGDSPRAVLGEADAAAGGGKRHRGRLLFYILKPTCRARRPSAEADLPLPATTSGTSTSSSTACSHGRPCLRTPAVARR